MNYPLLEKYLLRIHIGFGIYGFTRGFRTNYEHSFTGLIHGVDKVNSNRKLLFSERFFEGVVNASIYTVPIYNIYSLYCLCNRLEIAITGLKKDDYINYYKEPLSGYCFDTL